MLKYVYSSLSPKKKIVVRKSTSSPQVVHKAVHKSTIKSTKSANKFTDVDLIYGLLADLWTKFADLSVLDFVECADSDVDLICGLSCGLNLWTCGLILRTRLVDLWTIFYVD